MRQPQMGIYPKRVAMQGQPQMGIYPKRVAMQGIDFIPNRAMGIMPKRVSLQGSPAQMGSWFSDLTGINIDLSSTGQALITGGTEGAKQEIASQITSNPEIQALAYQATEKTMADKISYWIVQNKKMLAMGVIGVGALWVGSKVLGKK